MSRQEVLAAVTKHGAERRAAKALGISRNKLRAILGKPERAPVTVTEATRKVRTLTDFRKEFDKSFIVPTRIKNGLRTLGTGWDYEVSFAKLAGVSLTDLAAFRDQFADHIVHLERSGRRAWAGSKATADAMRRML